MRLVLASASPQRRALLERAGYGFEIAPAEIDEIESGLPPELIAESNAVGKARAAAVGRAGCAVVGADTVVALDGLSLGKPADIGQARAFLEALSGRGHEVHTAVCVIDPSGERSAVATTRLRFRRLEPAEITVNLERGEWRGRAGGYAIQHSAAGLVEEIDGELDTVIGLPVELLAGMLPEAVHRESGD